MEKIKAFLKGIKEFRSGCTTHYEYPLICSYDSGRDFAHRFTFRFFDN